MDVRDVKALSDAIRWQIAKAVVGQTATVDLLLTALLARGHILLEGPPGTAKTLVAQSFARTLDLRFGRVQFTPDLMPGDILGTNLFNFQTSSFHVRKGPIFCDLLLADEINRTPPKTQAALLEAMQERQVTLDGEAHRLSDRFMVVATQNPIEQQGTYPLPEAQLDRFLFKEVLRYPTEAQERAIVATHGTRTGQPDPAALGIAPVVVAAVTLTEEIVAYIVALVRATRESADIETGASPRSAAMLASAARGWAALDGRAYVIPDDVKALAPPALRHRVILSPTAEIEGRSADDAVASVIARIEPPR